MFLATRPAARVLTFDAVPAPSDAAGAPLRATRAYRPGDVVFRFEEMEWRTQRDRHTVEHPGGGHIFHPVLAMTAHSCDPNCCISFHARAMVAVRPIAAGETIAFDYQTTESWLSHPFWCLCGSRRCRGRIG